jgi:hypothetical protein
MFFHDAEVRGVILRHISTTNKLTLSAQILSLEVLFVKLLRTGLNPRRLKKFDPADFTVVDGFPDIQGRSENI